MEIVKVAAAIIVNNGQALIAQRPLGKHKGGYWEFPGGKIDVGESSEAALIRECREEVDIEVTVFELFDSLRFDYPDKKVHLQFFMVTQFNGKPSGLEGQPLRWVPLEQLARYNFPEANRPALDKLLQEYR